MRNKRSVVFGLEQDHHLIVVCLRWLVASTLAHKGEEPESSTLNTAPFCDTSKVPFLQAAEEIKGIFHSRITSGEVPLIVDDMVSYCNC